VIGGRSSTVLAACLAAFVFGACRSTDGDSGQAPKPDLSKTAFDQLIAAGALRPVEAAPEGAAVEGSVPDTDEETLARSAAKLKEMPPETPPVQAEAPAIAPVPQNPYLVFGKRILVHPESGLIMKPYPLRVGSGRQLLQLLQSYGNFALWQPGGASQTVDQVRLELYEKLDQELFSNLRISPPPADTPFAIADWLVVVASATRLEEVESFINIFAAGVPQIEIEAKIVEVTLTNQLDLGVSPIDSATPIFGFPDSTFVKSFTFNTPNSAGAVNSLLTIGAVQDGLVFNAVLQALATYENVSIISKPTIAVREGGRAAIENTVRIPVYAVSGLNATGQFAATLNYEEVGIKLYVIPRVVGTQTIALNIDIEASAQSGTAVTFTVPPSLGSPGFVLSNPTLSKRAAQTVVYLQPGQAVILGGLISERTVDDQKKVPLLGDIPLLGYLFRSTLKRKEQTNVLFFLRPRILQGTDLNREF
jgi:type II secretory pathway component GspD/PulD (secretin)